MTSEPRAEQLAIPTEYGRPAKLLDWRTVDARLGDAKHYWLATVRPDGRPHVVPLDGLWIDRHLYFGGSPTTAWQRALRSNPRVSMHLEDASSAVIVDGTCRVITPPLETAESLVANSKEKYGYAPPVSTYLGGVWRLSPVRVVAWTDLTVDATRFVFDS